MTDAELLERFLEQHDQAAFEALMELHGSMVFGVCRRILGNHHDAEDAFQATFLVLARSAPSILLRDSIASWLYGVAHRTALKAKGARKTRLLREKKSAQMAKSDAVQGNQWSELESILDRELGRLPETYRHAIILCDLEGKTYQEAARQLGSTERAISMRILRGRNLLAKRLTRHGLVLSVGTLMALLSQNGASASVPPSVLFSTSKAAGMSAASEAAAAGVISSSVAALTEGVSKSMFMTKLKIGTAVIVLIAVIGFGLGSLLFQMQAAEPPKGRELIVAKGDAEVPPQKNDNHEEAGKFGQYIPGKSIIIAISDDNQSVAGFSLQTGVWNTQDVNMPQGERIIPTISFDVACLQAGDRLWAFSGPKGSWHSIDVPAGIKARFSVWEEFVLAKVGNKLYAFSAIAPHWDSIELGKKAAMREDFFNQSTGLPNPPLPKK